MLRYLFWFTALLSFLLILVNIIYHPLLYVTGLFDKISNFVFSFILLLYGIANIRIALKVGNSNRWFLASALIFITVALFNAILNPVIWVQAQKNFNAGWGFAFLWLGSFIVICLSFLLELIGMVKTKMFPKT